MTRFRTIMALACALLLTGAFPALSSANHNGESHEFGNDYFRMTWERTDLTVAQDRVDRTWMWGSEPYSPRMTERYAQGPGGVREVQYFDKSRMEITQPGAERPSPWYVTNGLLVVEMAEGHIQYGDNTFDESPQPANIQIAGDPGSSSPTYADINAYGLRNQQAKDPGEVIDEYLGTSGVGSAEGWAGYGQTAGQYVPTTQHTVASVFWDFMTSTGLIFENGEFQNGELFQDPYYATGYPITEAYWVLTTVDGQQRDVMWQCFERRCLTYTPANDTGWQVEAGNVGQHYYQWRYPNGVATEEVTIYVVDVGNTRGVGSTFGCNDSLYPVQIPIETVSTTEAMIVATLQPLLAIDDQSFPNDDWYNALANSDLMVQSINMENGTANINLIGNLQVAGACDNPRIEEQLRQLVLQFEGVNDVTFTLNGEPMFPIGGA